MTKTNNNVAQKDGQLICPECGKPANDARALGTHRRFAHGIKGSAPSTLAYHQHNKTQQKATNQVTKSAAVPDKGMVEVSAKKRSKVLLVESDPAEEVAKAPLAQSITPVMLAYTAGRLESLAARIAYENGLPENEFVCQAAESFFELTRR